MQTALSNWLLGQWDCYGPRRLAAGEESRNASGNMPLPPTSSARRIELSTPNSNRSWPRAATPSASGRRGTLRLRVGRTWSSTWSWNCSTPRTHRAGQTGVSQPLIDGHDEGNCLVADCELGAPRGDSAVSFEAVDAALDCVSRLVMLRAKLRRPAAVIAAVAGMAGVLNGRPSGLDSRNSAPGPGHVRVSTRRTRGRFSLDRATARRGAAGLA